jgi:uncharacterized protein HemY
MKWLTKLIVIFILAIAFVFLLKFNNTTIVIFTKNNRIDVSLSIILVVLILFVSLILYGISILNKIRRLKNKIQQSLNRNKNNDATI